MPELFHRSSCSTKATTLPRKPASRSQQISDDGPKSDAGCCYRKTARQPPGRRQLKPNVSVALALLALIACSVGPLRVLAQGSDCGEATEDDDDSGGPSTFGTILNYLLIVVLVAASGLFSGLTLGLLGLDKIGLEIISNGDDPRMAGFAKVRRFCAIMGVGRCVQETLECLSSVFWTALPLSLIIKNRFGRGNTNTNIDSACTTRTYCCCTQSTLRSVLSSP